ncbi:MAG: HU family DNA-binding protein [Muribaculaceae bacterium]|nr:HU family DNA-binding protein [Muribaculaceae bacterium]
MDNKTIVDHISRKLDISRESVNMMIESLSKVFGNCGAEMDTISISGFGNFEPRKRQERIALHPASGKKLLVPPRITMVFKSSPILKQRINDGE